jgi:hypothetical protein
VREARRVSTGFGYAYSAGAHLINVDADYELLKVGVCEARCIVYAIEELEEVLLGVSMWLCEVDGWRDGWICRADDGRVRCARVRG